MQYSISILPFLLAFIGLWLILPRGNAAGRLLGILFGIAALSLVASQVPRLTGWLDQSVFGVMAITTIATIESTTTG